MDSKKASQCGQSSTSVMGESFPLGFTNNGTSFEQQPDSFHIILRNGNHQWSDRISVRIGHRAIGVHVTLLQQIPDQCRSSLVACFMEESPSCFRIHLLCGRLVLKEEFRHFVSALLSLLDPLLIFLSSQQMKNRRLPKCGSGEIWTTFQQCLNQWEISMQHSKNQWRFSVEVGCVDEIMREVAAFVVVPIGESTAEENVPTGR